MMNSNSDNPQEFGFLEVRVEAPMALFSRPEFKTERVSYDVMTPSAARGVLEAIFWKPQFRWEVREIWVLKPIEKYSLVRNEVGSKVSVRTAQRWAAQDGEGHYEATTDRMQRHALLLKDVAYLIRAQIILKEDNRPESSNVVKYRDQARRRVADGRCFARPYLGTREFACDFGPRLPLEQPIELSCDLGLMLYDLDYSAYQAKGRHEPIFFPARLERGILYVPPAHEVMAMAAKEEN